MLNYPIYRFLSSDIRQTPATSGHTNGTSSVSELVPDPPEQAADSLYHATDKTLDPSHAAAALILLTVSPLVPLPIETRTELPIDTM